MYNRGEEYYKDQKHDKAFIKFTEAVIRNHSDAQYILGDMHFDGLGTSQDSQQGLYWYLKSTTNHNNKIAQFKLGDIY